jgi:hypothetical protein
MARHHTVANESSVSFNLRQLMELEEARVHFEVEAARAAELETRKREEALREHATREAARAERAGTELQRVAKEAARLEQEREAALLRVRLGTQASERVELERHRVALEQARLATTRGRVAVGAAGCAAAAIIAALTYAALVQPPPSAAGDSTLENQARLLADQAHELAALRSQMASLTSAATPPERATSSVVAPSLQPPKPRQHIRELPSRHKSKPSAPPLLDVDSDSDDPISDL